MTRVCSHCPAKLGAKNTSGRCRRCISRHNAADPAWRAKQRAGVRAKFADPQHRAAHAARLSDRNRNLSGETLERRREHGRRCAQQNLQSPEMRARTADPAMKAENGRKRTDTVLAWCPPEYRDRYRHLKATKRMRAAEARALIEDEIASDERKRLAALSQFERQMERIRNGAKLIEVHPMRRADPTMTLGGVAPEAM